MPDLRDRQGYALSARSPIAAERYVEGLDRQLSLNAGGVEGLSAAVQADPGFALGYAGLAFALWYRQDVPAAKVSLDRARALVGDLTPRERQHVEIVGAFVDGEAARALPLLHEHLTDYPRDGLIMHLTTMTIARSGRLGRRQEAYDLLARLAPAWGDDWWFLGSSAI